MRVVELFCGTKSISKAMEKLGHETFTIDVFEEFKPDLCMDVVYLKASMIPEKFHKPDILWASPPCQTFSVASMGHYWDKTPAGILPKNPKAMRGLLFVEKTLELIRELQPKFFFIENPRGMLRKMPLMQDFHRKTVTYCQYGDKRQKPTDIWTNCLKWQSKPVCAPGSPCHEPAPRGSQGGTQGINGATDRGRIPEDLGIEIANAVMAQLKGGE